MLAANALTVTQRTVTLAGVPPVKPETVTVVVHDTVVRRDTVRDTIAVRVTMPWPLASQSYLHVDSLQQGQGIRFYRWCFLGMGHRNADQTIAIFPTLVWTSPPGGLESIAVRSQSGSRATLLSAAAALDSVKVCQ